MIFLIIWQETQLFLEQESISCHVLLDIYSLLLSYLVVVCVCVCVLCIGIAKFLHSRVPDPNLLTMTS